MKTLFKFLVFVLAFLLISLLLVGLFVRFVYFKKVHPGLPQLLSLQASINEIQTLPQNLNKITAHECVEIDIRHTADVIGIGSENIDLIDNCDEYVFSKHFSLLDFNNRFMNKTLVLKRIDETETNFVPLLSSRKEYPGWSYRLLAVEKSGEVYFEYGGWNYFGQDHEGTLLYKMEFLK